jgi:tetratricopeptide (TPR) repeat protein
MQGDVRYAVHILETTLRTLEEMHLNDPSASLRLHASLIGAYFQAGLYERAYSSAEEALRLAPNVSDPERLANMYLNAAWAMNHRGDTKESHEILLKAEHLFEEMELKLELGRARLARGMSLTRAEKLPAARKELSKAVAVFEEADSPLDLARCLNELARVQRLTGQVESAVASLERSVKLLKSEEHPAQLGWAYRELALTLWPDSPKVADKNLAKALELYHRADEPIELAVTYRYVGDLAADRGDAEGASEAYREGIVLLEKRT